MTDDQVRDLLDQAVRDHEPATAAPWRPVAERVRRRRHRQAALTAVATLVVGVGTATVVSRLDDGPSAPAAAPTLTDPRPGDGGSTVYLSPEGSITLWDDGLVRTPQGWADTPRAGARTQLASYECPGAGNVVYRATVMGADGTEVPCIGVTTTPYIWQRPIQVPNASAVLEQTIDDRGTVRWLVTLPPDPDGQPTYAAVFPQLGQVVVSRGLTADALVAALDPPAASSPAFAVPEVDGLSVGVRISTGDVETLPADDAAGFLDVLREQAAGRQPCDGDPTSYQFGLAVERLAVAFYTLTPVDGCLTLVSSDGAVVAPTPQLVALVRTAAATR